MAPISGQYIKMILLPKFSIYPYIPCRRATLEGICHTLKKQISSIHSFRLVLKSPCSKGRFFGLDFMPLRGRYFERSGLRTPISALFFRRRPAGYGGQVGCGCLLPTLHSGQAVCVLPIRRTVKAGFHALITP
jgi:hypothetical protein